MKKMIAAAVLATLLAFGCQEENDDNDKPDYDDSTVEETTVEIPADTEVHRETTTVHVVQYDNGELPRTGGDV